MKYDLAKNGLAKGDLIRFDFIKYYSYHDLIKRFS